MKHAPELEAVFLGSQPACTSVTRNYMRRPSLFLKKTEPGMIFKTRLLVMVMQI